MMGGGGGGGGDGSSTIDSGSVRPGEGYHYDDQSGEPAYERFLKKVESGDHRYDPRRHRRRDVDEDDMGIAAAQKAYHSSVVAASALTAVRFPEEEHSSPGGSPASLASQSQQQQHFEDGAGSAVGASRAGAGSAVGGGDDGGGGGGGGGGETQSTMALRRLLDPHQCYQRCVRELFALCTTCFPPPVYLPRLGAGLGFSRVPKRDKRPAAVRIGVMRRELFRRVRLFGPGGGLRAPLPGAPGADR